MKVYVLEDGEPDGGVMAVFATLAAAKRQVEEWHPNVGWMPESEAGQWEGQVVTTHCTLRYFISEMDLQSDASPAKLPSDARSVP